MFNLKNNTATAENEVAHNSNDSEAPKKTSSYVYVPRATVERGNEKVNVVLELPGADKKSIDVKVEKNLLSVTATNAYKTLEGYKVLSQEFANGDYKRIFEITDEVDIENIEAKYEDGILRLTLPLRKPITKKVALA